MASINAPQKKPIRAVALLTIYEDLTVDVSALKDSPQPITQDLLFVSACEIQSQIQADRSAKAVDSLLQTRAQQALLQQAVRSRQTAQRAKAQEDSAQKE